MITIFVLSFQGPTGGLTFPLRGLSLHWFHKLWDGGGIVDIRRAFVPLRVHRVSTAMVLTVVLSVLAGLAFRKRFRCQNLLFYVTVASLIVPSIIVVARHRAAVPHHRRRR